ncbi:hypothetical protein [Maritimibacter sp. UBA3975]|uniref:hypothetical protein n=1 Tax=Maritimibacter sp. UBA3975 TaxID=1946833 RepID=UPI000C0A5A58|nr:hypothetical protein [Maritimibacter sp. UBA3975]MAM60631.1 hypothetical protein [Maritimibacter sp.]|tara:strand:- start:5645 stop:6139 length:495 start_codon:yes stop_codon:yes gene_type:complete
MIRSALVMLLLTAAPALAQSCDTVGDGVLFCPDGGVWDGVRGAFDGELGVTIYHKGQVMLLTGPLPPFAYDTWVATPGDVALAAASFPAQERVDILDRPAPMLPGMTAETLLYQAQPDLISLVTVADLSGVPHMVQTVDEGTNLTNAHEALHRSALMALVEDGL